MNRLVELERKSLQLPAAAVDKKIIKGWLPKIKDKLIEQEAKSLSDAELERVFKGAVAQGRLIEYAKLMRESGDLKYSDIAPAKGTFEEQNTPQDCPKSLRIPHNQKTPDAVDQNTTVSLQRNVGA